MHRISLIISVAALALAAPLGAQQLGPSKVPEGHKPPPGMCRIWIDGVPPGRQSAPTDCATAVRNRPSNGRVIWGDDDRKRDEPRGSQGIERPREPRGQEKARESEERPRREPREGAESPKPREAAESPKPRETRETPRRQPDDSPRATPTRKSDDDSKGRNPERSTERKKPDFSREPR